MLPTGPAPAGFCASDDLAQEDPNGLCGNYGAYDVIAMFEWVKANIPNFGGDPENVTAFGQSAGAFLISHLLVSGKRLFRRAICQSGAAETMVRLVPALADAPSRADPGFLRGPPTAAPPRLASLPRLHLDYRIHRRPFYRLAVRMPCCSPLRSGRNPPVPPQRLALVHLALACT